LQFIQPQLQLLHLPVELFRPAPERHPAWLGDQQLQAFDLGLAPGPLFVLGLKLLTWKQNLLWLREDERFQGVLVQGVEIRKSSA
jgi:hypothetical protein